MVYPVIYTGLPDLREAIRDEFESNHYEFIAPETPEAAAAIASAEYAAITYHGGDTAHIEDFPGTLPMTVTLPIGPGGAIDGKLAAMLIRAHLEGWGDLGIRDIEGRVAKYRKTHRHRNRHYLYGDPIAVHMIREHLHHQGAKLTLDHSAIPAMRADGTAFTEVYVSADTVKVQLHPEGAVTIFDIDTTDPTVTDWAAAARRIIAISEGDDA
ncbi:hypothetical protein [Glycomyces artemisiae]|uniref:Uncharacterized protein n=1 Tax=Glycomyces artemisiae TaxID=1076443 RepID=A0A2T0UI51_9ACTN|nr:hypothetical protein [Glycomyces artemisiae]PRY57582.1 hypothetical protein B0I28_1062 [Glycomyces artemisiae]